MTLSPTTFLEGPYRPLHIPRRGYFQQRVVVSTFVILFSAAGATAAAMLAHLF